MGGKQQKFDSINSINHVSESDNTTQHIYQRNYGLFVDLLEILLTALKMTASNEGVYNLWLEYAGIKNLFFIQIS